GAGDAERDVELRRDGLAGPPDLRGVRIPARVHDGTGRADGAAERARELLREREVLGRAEAAATGDDDLRVLDRRAARLLELLAHDLRGARVRREVDRDLLDCGLAPSRRRRVERAGAEEREARRRPPADVDEEAVLQCRPLPDEIARDVD